jgi:integration host factor subunit beta
MVKISPQFYVMAAEYTEFIDISQEFIYEIIPTIPFWSPPMNKRDLIESFQFQSGLTPKEATAVVTLFFDEMTEALATGERVEVRGLCSIFVKNYKAYTGRNPKTGGKDADTTEETAIFQMWKGTEVAGKQGTCQQKLPVIRHDINGLD